MKASPEEIRAITENVLVLSTYWLNFRAIRGSRKSSESEDMGSGAFHVMALVAPYLAGEARRHLARLGREYMD
jgi:hypothetical protein